MKQYFKNINQYTQKMFKPSVISSKNNPIMLVNHNNDPIEDNKIYGDPDEILGC